MNFGICNEIFQGWDLPRTFRYAASLGYSAVEIAPFTLAESVQDLSPERRSEIRNSARDNGISIVGLHWLLVKPEGLYINHSDQAIRTRTSDYLRSLVDLCSDLGGEIMVLGSPKQRNLLPGVSISNATAWARETLAPVVQHAAERRITVCLEPLSKAETNFINTAAEAVEFVDSFNSRSFQVILDVKAMSSEAFPIPEVIRATAGKFGHFHANDKNLKGPGFGEIDFLPIAKALREVNYQGCVSVEVFDFKDGPEAIASKSIEYLRKVFEAV